MSRGCRFRWRRPSYVPCMWFLDFGLRGRNECANLPELAPRRRRRRAAAGNVERVGACGGLSMLYPPSSSSGCGGDSQRQGPGKPPASDVLQRGLRPSSPIQARCKPVASRLLGRCPRILFVFSSCFPVVSCATSRQFHRASVGFCQQRASRCLNGIAFPHQSSPCGCRPPAPASAKSPRHNGLPVPMPTSRIILSSSGSQPGMEECSRAGWSIFVVSVTKRGFNRDRQ